MEKEQKTLLEEMEKVMVADTATLSRIEHTINNNKKKFLNPSTLTGWVTRITTQNQATIQAIADNKKTFKTEAEDKANFKELEEALERYERMCSKMWGYAQKIPSGTDVEEKLEYFASSEFAQLKEFERLEDLIEQTTIQLSKHIKSSDDKDKLQKLTDRFITSLHAKNQALTIITK
ncbi:MAG: hypothetical protein ACMXYK_01940 [Candidatus Woesearchaeota archaeon]